MKKHIPFVVLVLVLLVLILIRMGSVSKIELSVEDVTPVTRTNIF